MGINYGRFTKSINSATQFSDLGAHQAYAFLADTLTDTIEFNFSDGIVCLAGANGLGKSTFLQVVGYGMTGVVPKPDQKFVTVDDYYRDIRAFTRDYFDGRILPQHLEI